MVLQQFEASWSGQPVPSAARQQADQLKRLPQETLGLYVAPHPRISNGSLYKMEQRLMGARKLDLRRLVKQLQEDFPDTQHVGKQLLGWFLILLHLPSQQLHTTDNPVQQSTSCKHIEQAVATGRMRNLRPSARRA